MSERKTHADDHLIKVMMPPELIAGIDRVINRAEYPTTRSAVIRAAVEQLIAEDDKTRRDAELAITTGTEDAFYTRSGADTRPRPTGEKK